MAVSFVSAAAAAANTVAMPAHAAEDLIFCFAYRKTNGAITVPAGWDTTVFVAVGGAVLGWKVAQSSSETTGTWTNAVNIAIAVYRKTTDESWYIGRPLGGSGGNGASVGKGITHGGFASGSTSIDWSTAANVYGTLNSASTWYMRFFGHTAATNQITNTPAGWTHRAGTATGPRILDTNGTSSVAANSVGGNTQAVSPTGGGAWFTLCFGVFAPVGNIWTANVAYDSQSGPTAPVAPQYQAGDLIIASALGDPTMPTAPAGWTSLEAAGTVGTKKCLVAYQIMTTDSGAAPGRTALGSWTNAYQVSYAVYRAAPGSTWNAPVVAAGTGSGTTVTFPNMTGVADPHLFWRSYLTNSTTSVPDLGSPWVTQLSAVGRAAIASSDFYDTGTDVAGDAQALGANTVTTTSAAWKAWTIQLSAVASAPPEGTASGDYGWSGAATGKKTPKATTAGAYGWSAAAAGKSQRSATAVGAYNWSSAAAGKKTPKATTAGSYQWEATEVGDADYQGQVNGAYGWATDSAIGDTPVSAPTANGSYRWSSTKVGYSARKATVAAAYGWSGSAAGKRTPKGLAGTWGYSWGSSAFGATPAKAAAGTFGYGWSSSSIGHRTGDGLVLAEYHFSSLATGHFTPSPAVGAVGWISE